MNSSRANTSGSETSYPYWKRVWQITSGSLQNATKIEIRTILFDNKERILKGILQFQRKETIQTISKERTAEYINIKEFLERSSDTLNVNIDIGWMVLKSYIINEYCGSVETIKKLQYEMNIIPMLNSIWKFFSAERMFLIKILRNIIEFVNDEDHPFYEVYIEFVKSVGFTNIWDSLRAQFYYLIHEIQGDDDTAEIWLKMWVHRNLRETIEIVHGLIMCTRFITINLNHMLDILIICKKHGFGGEPLLFRGYALSNKNFIRNITMSEVALIMSLANQIMIQGDTSWYEKSNKFTAEIEPLSYHEEDGAICFLWTMLHLSLPNGKAVFENKMEKYGIRAVKLNCYNFFLQVLQSEMFEETKCVLGATVHDAIFNLLSVGLEQIVDHEIIEYEKVGSVLGELLRTPIICEKFFNLSEKNGIIPIWSFAIELFPKYVDIFSKMAQAIIVSKCGHSTEVLNLLKSMPFFTEDYVAGNFPYLSRVATIDNLELIRLTSPRVCQQDGYAIAIPQNSKGVIKREPNYGYIHYEFNESFWKVVYIELNMILTLQDIPEMSYSRMMGYLKLYHAAVKLDHSSIKEYFSRLLHTIFILMNNFSEDYRRINLKIYGVCFDIITELLSSYKVIIISQFETMNLLPTLQRTDFDYKDVFNIDFLDHGKLGRLLLSNDNLQQEDFLISYFKFMRTAFLLNNEMNNPIVLPGTVFILKEVFPCLINWFNKSTNRNHCYIDIMYEVIHFLFEIFQTPTNEAAVNQNLKLRNIATEFLVNEICGRELLRIISVANLEIQGIMESQTNWRFGRGIQYILTVQKVMSILIQLLIDRHTESLIPRTPLENVIYTDPDGVIAIQAIACFVNHPFNENIPILSVRLLKKFATELQMSMLAALDLEPEQVRMMFVFRLRDRLEDDQLKLAIIELITACIPKQNGMTEAFFKVPKKRMVIYTESFIHTTAKCDDSPGNIFGNEEYNEGIGPFLVQYLYTFNSIACPVNTHMLARIMQVLHTLWLYHKEILIEDITKDFNFWPSVCAPLFKDKILSDITYAQIFNIISKEIHKMKSDLDENLGNFIKILFSPEEQIINNWLKYCYEKKSVMFDLQIRDNVYEPNLILALKDFFIIAVYFLPPNFFDFDYQKIIVRDIRHGLKNCVHTMDHVYNVTFLAELHFYLVDKWNLHCYKDDELNCFIDILEIIESIVPIYSTLPSRFLEVILATALKVIRDLKHVAPTVPDVTEKFIEAIGSLFMSEYETCVSHYYKSLQKKTKITSPISHFKFTVAIDALNDLMGVYATTPDLKYNEYFSQKQFLGILFNCVKIFIRDSCTMPLSKLALESLIIYSQTPNSKDFLLSDIEIHLWEQTITPAEYRNQKYLEKGGIITADVKEWWILYKKLIILLTLLLQQHQKVILKNILLFVSLHEDYICEILLLERYTVHEDALNLIKQTLIFIAELFKYINEWVMDHKSSFRNIVVAVKMSLNYSASVIVRPTVLKYVHFDNEPEDYEQEMVPMDLLVDILEKLTDIISLASISLLKFSPPIYKMLRDKKAYYNWPILVGSSFGIPSFGDNESCELTFGLLFCVANVHVRIIQQILNSKKSSQATPSREILVARKSRTSFSKSDDLRETLKQKSKGPEDFLKLQDDGEASSPEKEGSFCFSHSKQKTKSSGGYIKIDYLNPMYIISAVESFSFSSPAKSMPWYFKVNEEKATRALETVVTLIGSQVLHILYHDLQNSDKVLMKRELFSELQIFHELVRKKVIENQKIVVTSYQSYLIRKKIGFISYSDQKPDSKSFRGVPSKRSIDVSHGQITPTTSRRTSNRNSFSNYDHLSEINTSSDDFLQYLSIWFTYYFRYE